MQKHMVEEAGSRFFELASSMGRMHEKTLSGLASATAKTPFGPVFAINASLVRMANESIETLASQMNVPSEPVAARPTAKPAPAPKPAPASTPAPKASVATSPVAMIENTPKPVAKPKKAKKPAPFSVETSPATAVADAIEPDVADVLVEEVAVEKIVAKAKVPAKPKKAIMKDDLTLISGIGATTAKKLNGAGVESFAQIAAMSEDQFATLLASLEIKSIRFSPSLWIAEAKTRAT